MRRTVQRLLLSASAIVLLLCSAPAPVRAGHDASVEIQFWAFSRDGRFMLLVVKDLMRGFSTLAIKAVGNYAASVYEQELPPEIQPAQLPAYLAYPPFNQYGFQDAGATGDASPDGAGQIMASKVGYELALMFGKGEKMMKMFGIPLAVSPDRMTIGDAKVKEVRWSYTGKAVALIIHHSLAGEYGLQNDQIISFDPSPYKAKFAVPPQQPAAPQGGQPAQPQQGPQQGQ